MIVGLDFCRTIGSILLEQVLRVQRPLCLEMDNQRSFLSLCHRCGVFCVHDTPCALMCRCLALF